MPGSKPRSKAPSKPRSKASAPRRLSKPGSKTMTARPPASKKGSKRNLSKKSKKVSKRASKQVSPFGEGAATRLQGAFTERPRDEVNPCRYYCEQAYKLSPSGPFPPECGYQRFRDEKTGRFYWDELPQNRGCLTNPALQEGFELESETACQVWNRSFTRQQIVSMLRPYVSDPSDLRFLTKKELCKLLGDKASEVYYELESLTSNWCQSLQDDLEKTDMAQVFALLQLPHPATFLDKKEACATLLKRVAEMRPPWYSRLWRYVTGKTRDIFNWVLRNPGKTMLLAAGLLAAIYFAPQISSAAQSGISAAKSGVENFAARTRLLWMTQQASSDLSALDWSKVATWTQELQRLKQTPNESLSPQEAAFRDFLQSKLLDVTKGQLTDPSKPPNPVAEALARVTGQSQLFSRSWADTLDPSGAIRAAYSWYSGPAPTPAPAPVAIAPQGWWGRGTYDYLVNRFGNTPRPG